MSHCLFEGEQQIVITMLAELVRLLFGL